MAICGAARIASWVFVMAANSIVWAKGDHVSWSLVPGVPFRVLRVHEDQDLVLVLERTDRSYGIIRWVPPVELQAAS